MVNLALEPPNTPPRRPVGPLPKLLGIALLIAASGTAGFFLGRRTVKTNCETAGAPQAPVTAATATASAAPAPATAPGAPVAAPPSNAPSVPVVTPAPAQVAPTAPGQTSPRAPKLLATTLQGPLEQSIISALPSEDRAFGQELTQVVNRVLVWHLRVSRDSRKGDRIELLYLPPPGGEQRDPVVEMVRYTSLKLGRTFEAVRYRPEGSPFYRYYQPDGSELEERLIDGPIADYEQVTSLLFDGRRHKGVDFKAPVGTPVTAPFDAVVVRRNWNFASNGNCLEIVNPATGRHAIFLHLESVPRELQQGAKVRKGQQIARSGNSGHSTAPHLHYQLEDAGGRVLDPFRVHKTHRLSIEGAAKTAFDTERAKLGGLLTKG